MKKKYLSLCLILALCLSFFAGCEKDEAPKETSYIGGTASSEPVQSPEEALPLSTSAVEETMLPENEAASTKLHFISTGNSDCILIENQNEFMVIDGADNNDEAFLVETLKEKGVDRLKYVVLTHPDADHCGGLDALVEAFNIGQVFIGNGDADTKTYKDFVQAAIDKNAKPSVPLEGSTYTLGDAKLTFYNQKAQAKDVNDNSLVTLYEAADCKALFMGDAGVAVEKNLPLDEIGTVDVLKVGHHGSNTSSSAAFIKAVSPKYAVICCGKGNKYGHPQIETLEYLKAAGSQVYRTDLNGTITLMGTADGLKAEMESSYDEGAAFAAPSGEQTEQKQFDSKEDVIPAISGSVEVQNSQTQNQSTATHTVYVTETGKKYHEAGCQYLKDSQIALSEEEALEKGYTPCSKCQP